MAEGIDATMKAAAQDSSDSICAALNNNVNVARYTAKEIISSINVLKR